MKKISIEEHIDEVAKMQDMEPPGPRIGLAQQRVLMAISRSPQTVWSLHYLSLAASCAESTACRAAGILAARGAIKCVGKGQYTSLEYVDAV